MTFVADYTIERGATFRVLFATQSNESSTWTAGDASAVTANLKEASSSASVDLSSDVVNESGTGNYSITVETAALPFTNYILRLLATGVGASSASAPKEIKFALTGDF